MSRHGGDWEILVAQSLLEPNFQTIFYELFMLQQQLTLNELPPTQEIYRWRNGAFVMDFDVVVD